VRQILRTLSWPARRPSRFLDLLDALPFIAIALFAPGVVEAIERLRGRSRTDAQVS
jgi:hypothetical protein